MASLVISSKVPSAPARSEPWSDLTWKLLKTRWESLNAKQDVMQSITSQLYIKFLKLLILCFILENFETWDFRMRLHSYLKKHQMEWSLSIQNRSVPLSLTLVVHMSWSGNFWYFCFDDVQECEIQLYSIASPIPFCIDIKKLGANTTSSAQIQYPNPWYIC